MYFFFTSLFGLLPKASEVLFSCGFRCIFSSPAYLACCRRHRKFCFWWFPMFFLFTGPFGLLPKASEILFFPLSDVFPPHQHVSLASEGIGNEKFIGNYRMTPAG
jgi:hypothetical protein